jgi:hypothetical protein
VVTYRPDVDPGDLVVTTTDLVAAAFQARAAWTLPELGAVLDVPVQALRPALAALVDRSLIEETAPGAYVLVDVDPWGPEWLPVSTSTPVVMIAHNGRSGRSERD